MFKFLFKRQYYFYSYIGYSNGGVMCDRRCGTCSVTKPVDQDTLLLDINDVAMKQAIKYNPRVREIHILSLNKV